MTLVVHHIGDAKVDGDLRLGGTIVPPIARTALPQTFLAVYPIPWEAWRVWDAYQTTLPGTSATDDLGLIGGTWGTGVPSIQTYDVKALGALSIRARCMLSLPPEYDAGLTVKLRFHAGMLTTIADVSCTIDAECYKSNLESLVSGSDLVTTSAQSINSLSLADKDFTVTASTLNPGDILDLRVTIAVNDAATATAVKGIIGAASMLLDIRG